ncbi:single-stranded DNA-binding protein [Pseudoclavibacter sp. CFCC 13796]|uniref:single-stranded DNA-binding protein n=1 Tax=Pseudoclavibacter sp. CFCC 13796 TaxID=2615179 RepID=UPI0013016B93|nr:single-stranded DNA-binding protein [Pseudoclavibacter sp. CFCC 13796]KAB1661604.1 single-stranded DNA-binding protein [Pseudoclavibacter sp. CFCC 13796]
MANNVQTFYGNVTADPELRYTQGGTPVVSFSIAQQNGHFDRSKGEYVDEQATFLRVTAWRGLAENIAASLHKGQRAVVIGVLKQNDYEDREGNKRTGFEITADDVAASLLYGKSEFSKVNRGQGQANGGQQAQQSQPDAGQTASQSQNSQPSSSPAAPAADDDDDDDF